MHWLNHSFAQRFGELLCKMWNKAFKGQVGRGERMGDGVVAREAILEGGGDGEDSVGERDGMKQRERKGERLGGGEGGGGGVGGGGRWG